MHRVINPEMENIAEDQELMNILFEYNQNVK